MAKTLLVGARNHYILCDDACEFMALVWLLHDVTTCLVGDLLVFMCAIRRLSI